jgi:hypothetical protein
VIYVKILAKREQAGEGTGSRETWGWQAEQRTRLGKNEVTGDRDVNMMEVPGTQRIPKKETELAGTTHPQKEPNYSFGPCPSP